jgi:dihydrofolate synthase/folylpolyglutamate synthase
VSAPQPGEAAAVLERHAASVGAPLFLCGREWRADPTDDGFRYEGRRTLDLPRPALPGAHQIVNAATAIATLDLVVPGLSDEAIRGGLARVEWPGRLQRLTRGPLIELLPAGTTLTLDGGHNEHAATALAQWARSGPSPVDVVLAMRATKALDAFLAHLAPAIRSLRAVAIEGDAISLPPDRIAAAAQAAGIRDAVPCATMIEAVRSLATQPSPAPRILICGSLYLAGQVLERNG